MDLFNTNTGKDYYIRHSKDLFFSYTFKSQVCFPLTQITAFSCFWFGLSLKNVKHPPFQRQLKM